MKPQIICIHLFNDFSGSPRVLSQIVKSLIKRSYEVDIYTSSGNEAGFLSNINRANLFQFKYRWSPSKIITLLAFLTSQLCLFFKLLRYSKENVVFYVNTVLPIGAALAGKIMKKKVIYHIHETSVNPPLFKKFLFFIAKKTATEAIYVSHFLLKEEPLAGVNSRVVYNALSDDFILESKGAEPDRDMKFSILMLSSLKEYKGVRDFLSLSRRMKDCQFELILNATQNEINDFFDTSQFPLNLIVYPSQRDVHRFYQRSHLLLNLSHPDKWVETFGLTALEAMAYSLPVIVPPVGGIAEIVDDGDTGFKVDVRDLEKLDSTIKKLKDDKTLYYKMSDKAKIKSKQFSSSQMIDEIESVI